MAQKEKLMSKSNRLPHMGKLGIAILETRVKNLIGDDAIKILKKPVDDKDLEKALSSALNNTENRFRQEFPDKDLSDALLNLPLADLPSFQESVQEFYSHPTSSSLQRIVKFQFERDYPQLDSKRIEFATNSYFEILQEELILISDDIQRKLISFAILGIDKSLKLINEGDRLYSNFSREQDLSRNILVREFQTLVNERTRNFVGREYIFKAIDDLIASPEFASGYILIHGEPGIGKTSIIAQLVKTHGYLHHFNISTQNIRSTSSFLSNICSQLILRFELKHTKLPEDATKDSGFLNKLLAEVSEQKTNEPIIILIDALDEVDDLGLSPNSNRLYLPPSLPDNIYIIVTTREQVNYRLLVDNRQDIYIRDDDPRNVEDVYAYIKKFIDENESLLLRRASTWTSLKSEFIDVLAKNSQGNFMYLVHILRDIRDGKMDVLSSGNIQNLPVGLRQYYQRHWQSMRAKDKELFDKYEKPIICILATVKEPIVFEQLSEWTHLFDLDIRQTLDKWREFLNINTNAQGKQVYRIYHTSFQDFLSEEVGLKPFHELIVTSALGKIKY